MFNGTNGWNLSDLAAVCNNDSFTGNGGGIWFILILILLFGGFNGNGWGNNGTVEGYTLASDFANIQRQIDTTATATQNAVYQGNDALQRQVTAIGNGLSSLGYDQLSQFNNVNTNIMQSQNALQSQMSQCCCNTNSNIKDLQYNLAMQTNGLQSAMQTGFCQTNYNNSNNTRDIIDSQNCGTQAIIARIDTLERNAQQDKIASLQAENQRLMFAASQQAQNAYLIEQLKTTSV